MSEIPTQNFDHVHQHGSRRGEERDHTPGTIGGMSIPHYWGVKLRIGV